MTTPSAPSDLKIKSSPARQSIKPRRTNKTQSQNSKKTKRHPSQVTLPNFPVCVCVCVVYCVHYVPPNYLPPTALQGRQEKEKTREEKANKASNDDHRFLPPVVVTKPSLSSLSFFDTAKPFGNFALLIYYQSFPSALPSLTFSPQPFLHLPIKTTKKKKHLLPPNAIREEGTLPPPPLH